VNHLYEAFSPPFASCPSRYRGVAAFRSDSSGRHRGTKVVHESSSEECGSRCSIYEAAHHAKWSWVHKAPYTPHPIVFHPDGILSQNHGWTAKWEITGEREITVTLEGRKAVLHFDREVKKFRGTDFDGHRQIWGEIADDQIRSA